MFLVVNNGVKIKIHFWLLAFSCWLLEFYLGVPLPYARLSRGPALSLPKGRAFATRHPNAWATSGSDMPLNHSRDLNCVEHGVDLLHLAGHLVKRKTLT
jgi:hypothetical protein